MNIKLRLSERISTLTHYGNIYSFTTIFIAQFIYNNFHFVIGATLTVIAICSLIVQIIISSLEYYFLQRRNSHKLILLLDIHFFINHIIILIFIPFFIWSVVLMYKKIG